MKGILEIKRITSGQFTIRNHQWYSQYVILEAGVLTFIKDEKNRCQTEDTYDVKDVFVLGDQLKNGGTNKKSKVLKLQMGDIGFQLVSLLSV